MSYRQNLSAYSENYSSTNESLFPLKKKGDYNVTFALNCNKNYHLYCSLRVDTDAASLHNHAAEYGSGTGAGR